MTTNPPPTSSFQPSTKVQAQVAELRELEKQFPEPTLDDVKPDWEWLWGQFGKPEMESYLEQLVAVLEGKVVGSDPEDELALRIRLTKQLQRHPERFVISYYG